MDSFWMSAWMSAVLGIISFLLIHFQPYKTVPWVILLGGISCILFSVFVLTYLLINLDSPQDTCWLKYFWRFCF